MARRTRENEMSGIFDFLKRKKEQKSLFDLPAPSPPKPGELIPAKKAEKRSLIDIFRPKPHLPARPEPGKKEISLPEVFAPKLPALPEAPPPPPKQIEWGELIPPPSPPEAKPISEVVRTFRSRESPAPKYVFIQPSAPPEIEPRRSFELIVAPQTRVEWKLPSVEELAAHFRRTNNLEAMWDYIRNVRADPDFKREQLASSWRGVPITVPLDPIVYREKYTDFANFYGIPWAVMELYLNVPPALEKEAEEALWKNVISPLNIMVPEAFELLKPQDIPGFFNVSFIEPSGQYYLFYVEPLLGIGG